MFQILKDESSALHHRICMLENDNDVTKQCLRAPIDVAAMRYESNHLHEKNAALENHIEKLRDHEKNTLGMRSCELSARVRTLESDINDVCLKICSIFDATELSLPEGNEQIYNGLFERALKPSSWSEITKSSAPSPLMSDAFRILSAIHVCVRIFEDRAFDSLTAVEPFLNGWRRMTLCDGGSDALRKFDLLGLSSSLRSKAFDRQVKAKAQALSHEIVATISDLTHQCGDHQFHPLRNIQSTAICLSDFESLFGNALKLKAELMLTGQEYTAFFVPSGTKFNPEMMEKAAYSIEEPCWKRRSGFSEDDERTNKPQTFTVNICLFPAICAYTSEPKRDRQAINWKTVRPLEDAWKRYYNIEDLKAMGAKTLSKAVVLLR
ncbi:hypothetical protein TruAng_003681 [Truncatella angustata]|nr:hypothetical protein TruAng_003681 [Truncatella angustata]